MLRRLLLVSAIAAGLLGLPAAPASANSMTCPAFNGTIHPGGEISRRCTILNLDQSRDATFYTFIVQDSLRVYDASDNLVTGADRDTFLSFFSWSQDTQIVTTARSPLPTRRGEEDDVDLVATERFRRTCDHRALTSLTGDNLETDTCRIGRVRRLAYAPPTFNRRDFIETVHMSDSGDQTKFAGWYFSFAETFRARVPAASDCPSSGCPTVYER